MILKDDHIVFFSRSYRKQYLYPYIEKYINSEINSFFLFNKKIIINDFPHIILLKILLLINKNVYIFLWNNLDELQFFLQKNPGYIPIINSGNIKFLFPFEIDKFLLKQINKTLLNFEYDVFLPMYNIRKLPVKLDVENKIIFFGEIDILSQDDKLYNEIKSFSYKILNGAENYYNIEEFVLNNFGELNYYENVLKIRNFVRYIYLEEISTFFNKNLILIGSSLSKINRATNLSSNYSFDYRTNFYKKFENCVFLDLLSKSSSSCLYPRSQELLEFTYHIFQLKTFDSKKIINLSNRVNIFNSINDLVFKLNNHFINKTK